MSSLIKQKMGVVELMKRVVNRGFQVLPGCLWFRIMKLVCESKVLGPEDSGIFFEITCRSSLFRNIIFLNRLFLARPSTEIFKYVQLCVISVGTSRPSHVSHCNTCKMRKSVSKVAFRKLFSLSFFKFRRLFESFKTLNQCVEISRFQDAITCHLPLKKKPRRESLTTRHSMSQKG